MIAVYGISRIVDLNSKAVNKVYDESKKKPDAWQPYLQIGVQEREKYQKMTL